MCTKFHLVIDDPHHAIKQEDDYPVSIQNPSVEVIVHKDEHLKEALELLGSGLDDEDDHWLDDPDQVCEVNHYYGK